MRLVKNLFVAQAALLVIFLLSLPLFRDGFFRMHDYTHVARLVEMLDALRVGHFPVHWSADFGYGYGMPLFLFYGPVPFYLASLPALMGLSPLLSIKLLILFTNFTAWTGMYSLMKRWGRTVGFVAATVFALAPYRALDLYVRGALNELFALSLLPWILHFAWLITRQRRVGWLGLSLTTSALIASHNLTAMIALPFLGIMSLVWITWQKSDKLKSLGLVTAGYLTGVLLSAWYALPAFLEKDSTIISEITTGYFDYHLHFLYLRQFWQETWGYGGSTFGPHDEISFHFGWISLLLATLAGVGALAPILNDLKTRRKLLNIWIFRKTQVLILFTALVLVPTLLLSTFKTQWLWDRVALLSFVQFPWRFLAISNVLMAMLAGWGIWQIRHTTWRWPLTWLTVILLLISQLKFHQPQQYLENNDDFYYTDRQLIRRRMSDILLDYLPSGFDRQLPPVEPAERIVISDSLDKTRWEINQPHRLLLETETIKGSAITWNIADFPGWQYYVNDEQVEPELLPDGRRQLTAQPELEIDSVGAIFTMTPLRQTGLIISLIALIGWLAVFIKPKDKHVEF